MITPVYKDGMILWVRVQFAHMYEPFPGLGDHGEICHIKCEEL